MRPLGEALAAREFPVRGVRLAGHGTRVDDLARTTWPDWFRSVEDEAIALAREAERIVVVGMSMGAVLALHLAAAWGDRVAGLVLCGTALEMSDARVRLLPLLTRVPGFARRFALLPKTGRRDIADPGARATSFTYDTTPLSGVLELLRLQRVVRRELHRVTQPALLLHGRHDHTIPVTSLARLRRRLGSVHVEAHVLERSWHVITLDVEREDVARLAGDFLDRVERGRLAR